MGGHTHTHTHTHTHAHTQAHTVTHGHIRAHTGTYGHTHTIIIDPFILQAWVFLHTIMKSANLKSRQRFLSKPPNMMFTYISAFMGYFTKYSSSLHYNYLTI